jgi:iron complex outermembrane recepter protein
VRLDPAVYGTVSDAMTGEPLDAAHVDVDTRTGMTAPNGAYYIAGVERGTHTLRVTKVGYEPFTTTVEVDEELVSVKVKLRAE